MQGQQRNPQRLHSVLMRIHQWRSRMHGGNSGVKRAGQRELERRHCGLEADWAYHAAISDGALREAYSIESWRIAEFCSMPTAKIRNFHLRYQLLLSHLGIHPAVLS